MIISFDVNNQIISRTDENRVVSKSVNYLIAKFSFSEDWNKNSLITPLFISSDKKAYTPELRDDGKYIDEEGCCFVPHEALEAGGILLVSVTEYDGELKKRITANTAVVHVEESGETTAQTSLAPEPSVYEKLISDYKEIKENALMKNNADLKLTDRLLQLTANGEAVGDGVQLPQEKFELWNDITLEEDAVSVTMSQTQGGAPINIKKLFVLFTGNTANMKPLIVLNYNGGNIYQMWQSVPWNDLETNFTLWAYSEKLAPGVFRSLYSKTPMTATNLDSLQGTSNANTEVGGCVARWANPNATYQKATKWTFGATSGLYTLKAGSRILVYGVQDTDS